MRVRQLTDDVFLIGSYYGDYNKIIYIEGVK